MVSCLLGQLSLWHLSSQSELALWLVELYYLMKTTLFFIPFEPNLKWQLSLGAVVAWAAVPPIRGSLVASLIVLFSRPTLIFVPFKSDLEWLSYGQLSPGAVVAWAFVFLIRANFVAS